MTEQRARASGELQVDTSSPPAGEPPLLIEHVGKNAVSGQMSAVINVHACNLNQIEVAIQNNLHEVDPHPNRPGEYLSRHPIYLVAFDPDPGKIDQDGHPAEGAPSELNLKAIREIFSARYPHVSPDAPPSDGSHIRVDGMHVIAEVDRRGNPTGRVTFGNPKDVR